MERGNNTFNTITHLAILLQKIIFQINAFLLNFFFIKEPQKYDFIPYY